MSLDKAIKYGKEKPKPYTRPKSVDRTCRNHGSCPACYQNRHYVNIKRLDKAKGQEKEELNMNDDISNPLESFHHIQEKGYHQGLCAAAYFIGSGKSFESWYGDGPTEINKGWLYLLMVLNREQEYWDLKQKLIKEKNELELNKE